VFVENGGGKNGLACGVTSYFRLSADGATLTFAIAHPRKLDRSSANRCEFVRLRPGWR
jgi:hypothetical protein